MEVDCETSFPIKSFKLTLAGFHLVDLRVNQEAECVKEIVLVLRGAS